jgi:outer membrane protein TolC
VTPELRRLATELPARALTRDELAALAYLRSPAVRAARARVEAARTGYAQSADLADLVALYRSFLRDTQTRVGPDKSRRATERIAPSPNIDALSGELVQKTIDIAFQDLRRVVRDTVAEAGRAHADAVRLKEARRVLRDDVALHKALVAVLRTRFEAGLVSQAGLLAFRARLEALRTELEILDEETAVVRARWNRLLSRPENAAVVLDVAPSGTPADEKDAEYGESQELRAAVLAAERATVAVRLAETMTLPRMDLGSSRFERERAGEAGVQRGEVFKEPGRGIMPRWDFGVREAQVTEMRARLQTTERARDAERDRIATRVREALYAVDASWRRWSIHDREIVPLAERSFQSTRGAYEGNRAGYIELLDSARRLLKARLQRIDARRDHAHARARLLEATGGKR